MDFIKRIFGSNSTPKEITKKTSEDDKEVMVGITSVSKDKLPEGAQLIAESQIPAFCMIGNLIFEKKYREAIELVLSCIIKRNYIYLLNKQQIYETSKTSNFK